MFHPNYGEASDLTLEDLRNLRAHYCEELLKHPTEGSYRGARQGEADE